MSEGAEFDHPLNIPGLNLICQSTTLILPNEPITTNRKHKNP